MSIDPAAVVLGELTSVAVRPPQAEASPRRSMAPPSSFRHRRPHQAGPGAVSSQTAAMPSRSGSMRRPPASLALPRARLSPVRPLTSRMSPPVDGSPA